MDMIENEIKYVLALESIDHIKLLGETTRLEIQQGYDKRTEYEKYLDDVHPFSSEAHGQWE